MAMATTTSHVQQANIRGITKAPFAFPRRSRAAAHHQNTISSFRGPQRFRGLKSCAFCRQKPAAAFVASASAIGESPLVGNMAPNFEAEAVLDQEFVKFSHLAWAQIDRKSGGLGDLRYPLASDLTKTISRTYNVLIRDQGVALRGLFIIDKSGIIQYATVNNLAFGRSVDETLRTLQAIQYVQQHPDQVCPAGWKPGEKSISSSPKLGKDYFAAI